MSIRNKIGLALCIVGPILAAGSWMFGVYDARRDANQALILDASLRESGFISSTRYKVHLFFGADPDRSGEDYWGESALEAATRRHNQSALDALIPRVSDETFRSALIKACAAENEVGAALLVHGRYPEDGSSIVAPCDRLLGADEHESNPDEP